jgi:hypothetical protein
MFELYIRFYDEIVSVGGENLTCRLGAEWMFVAVKSEKVVFGSGEVGVPFFPHVSYL